MKSFSFVFKLKSHSNTLSLKRINLFAYESQWHNIFSVYKKMEILHWRSAFFHENITVKPAWLLKWSYHDEIVSSLAWKKSTLKELRKKKFKLKKKYGRDHPE